MPEITPFLWFDTEAEEAAKYYVSVFKDAKLGSISRYDDAAAKVAGRPAGSAMTVSFQLERLDFTALNGGPTFKFTEAVSFVVLCEDQAEIDYYWERLSAVPEAEQCGWCKDRFGLSWQIIPKGLSGLIGNPGGMQAMLKMKKLIVTDLEAAADQA